MDNGRPSTARSGRNRTIMGDWCLKTSTPKINSTSSLGRGTQGTSPSARDTEPTGVHRPWPGGIVYILPMLAPGAHRQGRPEADCVPGAMTWCDADEARREAMTDAVMRRVRLTPTVVAVVALGLLSLVATQLEPTAGARDGSYHGYFALRLAAGEPVEVVDELHADRVFVPASVLKVLTVAAALEHLGAAYRWRTRLSPRGTVAGSILDGDLVVEAGADPTWSSTPTDGDHVDPFMALADQLRASGLTLITGDLIIDTTRFPGRPHPVDRGYDDLPYRHGTPPAALSLDEATVSVRVAPGPIVGAPALILAPDGIDIINHTTTVGRDRHGAGTLDFLPLWGTDTLLLRGEYPISEAPFVMAASDPTPELRVAQRLRSTLAETGVRVEGTVQLQSQGSVPSASGPPLAEFRSAPLGDLLQETLTESHNWYADMLTLTLALEVAGSGRFDDGVEVISDFVRGLVPDRPQGTIALSIQDGSGLSPSNLVTTHNGRARARLRTRSALGSGSPAGDGWTGGRHAGRLARLAADRSKDRNAASHRCARRHSRSRIRRSGGLLLLRQPPNRAAPG